MDTSTKPIKEQILDLIKQSPQTISTIKRTLGLDYKNAWRYCRKLYEEGIVELKPNPKETKKGKPVYVLLKVEEKERDYIYKILKEIQQKSKIDFEDYSTLSLEDLNYSQRLKFNSALFKIPFIKPSLIKREISLTLEGKKFLKENDNTNSLNFGH